MLGMPLLNWMPIICLSSTALEWRDMSHYVHIRKGYRNIGGSPCRRPLMSAIMIFGSLFIRIGKDTDITHIIILLIQYSLNPNLIITASKNDQFIW